MVSNEQNIIDGLLLLIEKERKCKEKAENQLLLRTIMYNGLILSIPENELPMLFKKAILAIKDDHDYIHADDEDKKIFEEAIRRCEHEAS